MMTKASKYISTILFAGLALGSQATTAATVGGYTFDDNAYVDVLIGSVGSYTVIGGAPDVSVAVTDTDAGTGATEFDNTAGAYLQLGFTDNFLVNGAGDDLVLFELGAEDSFELSLTLNGASNTYATVPTGQFAGGLFLNAVAIDLDDFGVASGATFSDFIVGMDIVGTTGTRPILSLAAALNSTAVPVPAAVWLFGSGLLGLAGMARRKKVA